MDIENPTPKIPIDVSRHNDRIEVRVSGKLAATRDEASGSIAWHAIKGFTESDREVIRNEVFAKLPWHPRFNRAQRRHMARAQRRGPTKAR